jgi:CheY-like chemotaxis protein/class 3 adenylate cyclase
VAEEGRGEGEDKRQDDDIWNQRRVYEEQGDVREKEQEISFTTKSQSYCICFVSMVDSTETTFTISYPDKIRRYYSIFINTMAAIVRTFGAKIIKNTGTSVIYYFPRTSNLHTLSAFTDVVECGVTMMAANKVINMKLKEERLPCMHYKISADYGRVEVARSLSSPCTDDLFGSTMNVCAKINSMAPVNGMVIGSDLYYIINKFSSSLSLFGKGGNSSRYHFKKIGEYSIMPSVNYQYPVYSVSVAEGTAANISYLEKHIPKLQQQPCKIENQVGLRLVDTREIKEPKEQQQTPQSQQKKGSPTATSAITVILVDDEPDILLTYKTYLASAGYNVDAFADPREALMHFEQTDLNTYNLVIIDIRMPSLNGIQVYYRLKTKNPNIKILFVSALDAAQEMVSILPGIGLEDVLKKPVDNKQFLSKVKAVLNRNNDYVTI